MKQPIVEDGNGVTDRVSDTIAAVATPPGNGAIAIVRLSGPEAHPLVTRHLDRPVGKFRRLYHRNFLDSNSEIVDEVLVAFYKAPNSYTGEDMAEIFCHGGALVSQMILQQLLASGARLAKNGEFTKRAVLNGKMDLVEAEAVLQIIEAKSEQALKLAVQNLRGALSKELVSLRERFLLVLSKIEVSVDYGEDVVIEESEIREDLRILEADLRELLSHAHRGLHASTGVLVAIVGRPNVGKSTLLNRLLREDRAIVTHIPGTTRDVVRGEVRIGGMLFVLSDTAGIRQTDDLIEKLGIEKTIEEIRRSDLVLHVLDASVGWTGDDTYISQLLADSKVVRVWNKSDLRGGEVAGMTEGDVLVSALTGEGIVELEERLALSVAPIVHESELSHITTKRQLEYLTRVHGHVREALSGFGGRLPIDIAAVELRRALVELDTLLGRNYTDDLLDTIFSNFCVGK